MIVGVCGVVYSMNHPTATVRIAVPATTHLVCRGDACECNPMAYRPCGDESVCVDHVCMNLSVSSLSTLTPVSVGVDESDYCGVNPCKVKSIEPSALIGHYSYSPDGTKYDRSVVVCFFSIVSCSVSHM